MTSDRYYVCTNCGHYWSSPHPPDDRRCESCSRTKVTTSVGTLEEAEEASERVMDEILDGVDERPRLALVATDRGPAAVRKLGPGERELNGRIRYSAAWLTIALSALVVADAGGAQPAPGARPACNRIYPAPPAAFEHVGAYGWTREAT